MTPFKDNGHLTEDQKQFNYKISSTRMVVENAFGLLKGRFRRLKFFDNKNINFIVECVVAATVFHNIAVNMKEEVNETIDVEDVASDDNDDRTVVVHDGEDFRRRDQLFVNLFQ